MENNGFGQRNTRKGANESNNQFFLTNSKKKKRLKFPCMKYIKQVKKQ